MICGGTVRLTLLAAGAAVAAWTAYVVPTLANQAPIESLAKRIAARENYQSSALSGFKSSAADWSDRKWHHPSVLAPKAVVDVRLLERVLALSDTGRVDEMFAVTEVSIQRSLAAVPADPFLWTIYFWVENNRLGFRPKHLEYLKMSYATGPSEGWVAVSRARFALALFRILPPEMADAAVTEFSRLVGSSFHRAAIDLLSRQSEPLTLRLLASLSSVDFDERQNFARAAYKLGYDWQVPGIEKPEWRPWH